MEPFRHEEDQTILQVMRRILDLESEACRESALYGLGHWHLHYPDEVRQLVDEFLGQDPPMSEPFGDYAMAARSGCVA
jgi:hypothetical protein